MRVLKRLLVVCSTHAPAYSANEFKKQTLKRTMFVYQVSFGNSSSKFFTGY